MQIPILSRKVLSFQAQQKWIKIRIHRMRNIGMWQREEREDAGPLETHIEDVVPAEGGDGKWLDHPTPHMLERNWTVPVVQGYQTLWAEKYISWCWKFPVVELRGSHNKPRRVSIAVLLKHVPRNATQWCWFLWGNWHMSLGEWYYWKETETFENIGDVFVDSLWVKWEDMGEINE